MARPQLNFVLVKAGADDLDFGTGSTLRPDGVNHPQIHAGHLPVPESVELALFGSTGSSKSVEEALLALQSLVASINRETEGIALTPGVEQAAALRYHTQFQRPMYHDGSKWRFMDARRSDFAATSSMSTFGASEFGAGFGFVPGELQVFLNGVLLLKSDYSEAAPSEGISTSFTLSEAIEAGDNLSVIY